MSSCQVLCWNIRSRVMDDLLIHLERAGFTECRLLTLVGHEELVGSVVKPTDLLYPVVDVGAGIQSLTSILDLPSKNAEGASPICVELAAPAKLRNLASPPHISYLDKNWRWAELFLKIVETFGCSAEKSVGDPEMPEDFLMACLRRNIGIETYKDGRIIIDDLLLNRLLVEVQDSSYKLFYHVDFSCLNSARDVSDWDEGVTPPLAELLPALAEQMARVVSLHSLAYLEVVDGLSFLNLIDFDPTNLSVKLLVDLCFLFNSQLDLMGVSADDKMHYAFAKGKKVDLGLIRRLLKHQLENPSDLAAVECVVELKWTLSTDTLVSEKIKTAAVELVVATMTETEGSVVHVPTFLKSLAKSCPSLLAKTTGRSIKYYDVHLSPF